VVKIQQPMTRSLIITALASVSWNASLEGATYSVCHSGCTHPTINSAIAAAACGDKIQISTAQTHFGGDGNQTANNPVVLRYKNCAAGNPIVITSNRERELPAAGTRITPSYADGATRVVPLIFNAAYGPILTADVGNAACGGKQVACPAHDYTLLGLEFAGAAYGAVDFIAIGETSSGSLEPLINSISDLPSNIIFDRVLVRSDPLQNTRRCITFDGVNMTIMNSWIECGFDTGSSDSQALIGYNPQSLRVLNNFISGTTETINFSGGCSPIRTPKTDNCTAALSGAQPRDVEIAYNDITKPTWARSIAWTPSTHMSRAQSLHPTAGSSPPLQAMNAGTTGATEPVWPKKPGDSVVDGTVTWVVSNGPPQVKNLMEAKAMDSLNVHHNFLHIAYPQGQQGYAFTFSTRTSAGAGGGNWSSIKNVTVESNVVTDVGSGINTTGLDDSDPNSYASVMTANREPYRITPDSNTLLIAVNGGPPQTVRLTPGPVQTAQQIVNDLNAQLKPGIACLNDSRVVIRASDAGPISCAYGSGKFSSSLTITTSTKSAYAVLGLSPGAYTSCVNPRTGVWYGCGSLDGLFVRNNLWAKLNVAPNLSGVPYVFGIFNKLQNVQISHNTLDGTATGGPVLLMYSEDAPNSNVTLRNNILGQRGGQRAPISGYGTLLDFSAINYLMCNVVVTNVARPIDAVCPPGVVSHNLLPGVTLWTHMTRDTRPFKNDSGYNSYPSDNFNDAFESVPFKSPDDLDYSLGPQSKFSNAGTDGRDIGVDTTKLPLIQRLDVTTSEKSARFSFTLTEPIRGIPCVLRVSTDQDMTGVIADLDPSQFTKPDSTDNPGNQVDGAKRVMWAGKNVALSPGTVYYYYLGCGGHSRSGSFQTTGAAAKRRMLTNIVFAHSRNHSLWRIE
jgi:hypothetical protein